MGPYLRKKMSIDFRDRVSKILDASTRNFGEDVVLMPKKGGQYNIRGIFDNEWESVDPDTEQVISSQQPVLGINLHGISIRPISGDKLKIRNLKWFYHFEDHCQSEI